MPWGSGSPPDVPIFNVTCADWGGPGFGVMVSVADWPEVFAEVVGAEPASVAASFLRQEPKRVTRKMPARQPRTTRPPVQADRTLLLAGSILLETSILGLRPGRSSPFRSPAF